MISLLSRPFRAPLLALALLAGSALTAQAQYGAMSQSILYSSSIGNVRTATDAAGNTYYAGCYEGAVEVAGTEVIPAGPDNSVNLYVAKFDALGQLLWIKHGGSPATDIVYAVTLDGADGLYVSAVSGRDFRFGTTTLDSAGTNLLRFNTVTGSLLWGRTIGHTVVNQAAQPTGVHGFILAANSTAVYLGGNVINNASLDGIPLQNTDIAGSVFVAKCSPTDGVVNAIWQCVPTAAADRSGIGALRLSAQGDVVITGGYMGTVQFGATAGSTTHTAQVATSNQYESFVARITPTAAGGTTQHVLDRLTRVSTLALDAHANCYFTGFAHTGAAVGSITPADSGLYVARLDRTGLMRWVKGTNSNLLLDDMAIDMVTDAGGRVYMAGFLRSPSIRFGAYTITNSLNGMRSFVVCHDSLGVAQWARSSDTPTNDLELVQGLSIDAANRLYLAGFYSSTVPASYDGHLIRPQSHYLVRLDPSAEVNGHVYLDENGNGVRDAGESAFPRPVIVQESTHLDGASYASDAAGLYHALLPVGAYDLQAAPPIHYTVSHPLTNRQSGTLAAFGQVHTDRDFGLAPVTNQQDLRVTLTPYTLARRGVPTRYRARIENIGTRTVAGGLLTVQIDAAATIVGTIPTSTQPQPQVRTWTFGSLAPFATRDYDITLSLPINTTLGTPIVSTATVAAGTGTDLNPADNTDTLAQQVIGSFDPNDLTVNYSSLTAAQIATGVALDYVVNFQNMGNDTAFAVVVHDSLPAGLLQLATIEVVSQSHNVEWSLSGPGLLTLRFPNIRLPYQALDAVRSQGFVRFRITPRATLTPGTLIPNRAHITFDYNAPLATNQATTLVQGVTGLPREAATASLSVYPNPATSQVALSAELATAGTVAVRLVDALGRPVRRQQLPAPAGALHYALDLTGVTPGLYVVQLTLPDGHTTAQRLVVGQ